MPFQKLAKRLFELVVQLVDAPEPSPRAAKGELDKTGTMGQKLRQGAYLSDHRNTTAPRHATVALKEAYTRGSSPARHQLLRKFATRLSSAYSIELRQAVRQASLVSPEYDFGVPYPIFRYMAQLSVSEIGREAFAKGVHPPRCVLKPRRRCPEGKAPECGAHLTNDPWRGVVKRIASLQCDLVADVADEEWRAHKRRLLTAEVCGDLAPSDRVPLQ